MRDAGEDRKYAAQNREKFAIRKMESIENIVVIQISNSRFVIRFSRLEAGKAAMGIGRSRDWIEAG